MAETLQDSPQLESTTVKINRTAATIKGGRRMSFSALVVVGDRRGNVGIGYGKAPGVPAAIEKAQKDARKKLVSVKLQHGTLPHPVTGKFGSSSVRLIPAAPGTGVVAGGTVRAVLEMVGVHDCLTKAYGSTNEINVCKAVMAGLGLLRMREDIERLRGQTLEQTTVESIIEASKLMQLQANVQAEQQALRMKQENKAMAVAAAQNEQEATSQQNADKAEKAETAEADQNENPVSQESPEPEASEPKSETQ